MEQNLILNNFSEPVTALADTPALAAAELKRRFQAPAEELRQVHNALAEQHNALHEKVEGIVAQTYGGTIHESMLDSLLATKINGKADQSALEEETAAREAIDETIAELCRVCYGTYVGDGEEYRTISLPFTPKVVFLIADSGYITTDTGRWGGLAFDNAPLIYTITNGYSHDLIRICDHGFIVSKGISESTTKTNNSSTTYRYFALA